MESFFTRYKNALVLMLVLLAQVVLLAMQVRRPAPDMPEGHNVRLWRYVVAGVVTPPERLAHNIGLQTRRIWSNYIHLRNLREQNLALEAENDRLRLEQASLAEDAREGQRLRDMLDFRGRYIDKTVPAQVIGTAGTDQAHAIYIDKGFNEGIRVQMPVITPDGIIGKVKNVFPHTSQVLLISDQTSGAGVMLESTRIRGVMKGNASGQPQMINISPDERIKPGEAVLTSGGDQVYPRGLPVGTVQSVIADPDTSYVNVVVKPNANLAKLEEVMVVTEFSGKMPFSQEKDMMQSEVDALALRQRAADVLSDRLPSLREVTVAGASSDADAETAGGGDPARPMRPPQPLHADRYTPGAAPPAAALTPGAAPPITHRAPSAADGTSSQVSRSTARVPMTAASGGEAPREAAPLNRFPPRVVPAPERQTASTPVTSGTASASSQKAAATAGSAPSETAAPRASRVASQPPSGLALPLQPADSGATRRAAAPALNADGSVAVRPLRPAGSVNGTAVGSAVGNASAPRSPGATVSGSPTASSGAAQTTPAIRSSTGTNPAGTSPGTLRSAPPATTTPTQASGQAPARPANAPPARRIVIPSDGSTDGILAPVGMGAIGSTPRPRAPQPAGTPPDGSRPAGTAVKPAPARTPATTMPQPARTPASSAPPGAE